MKPMFVVPHLIGTNFMYISEDPPYLLFFSSYTNDAKCAAGMACNNHQRERCVASEMEACWESITPQASIQPYDAENDPYCPLVRGCTVRDALYKPARALVLYTVPLLVAARGMCKSMCNLVVHPYNMHIISLCRCSFEASTPPSRLN